MTPMKIVIATIDFIVINAVLSFNMGISVSEILFNGLCVGLAFGLRMAMLVKDNKYSVKTMFIHAVFTISWVFFVVLLWRTSVYKYLDYGGNSFQIYLFLNSLFSVYMVSQFEYFFKIGFRNWLRMVAGRIVAKDVKEDNL